MLSEHRGPSGSKTCASQQNALEHQPRKCWRGAAAANCSAFLTKSRHRRSPAKGLASRDFRPDSEVRMANERDLIELDKFLPISQRRVWCQHSRGRATRSRVRSNELGLSADQCYRILLERFSDLGNDRPEFCDFMCFHFQRPEHVLQTIVRR